MKTQRCLTAFLTGLTLLALAGLAQAQGPEQFDALKNKIKSLEAAHPKAEISSPGQMRTLTILPGTCPLEYGMTLGVSDMAARLNYFWSVGLDIGLAMQWGTNTDLGDLTPMYLSEKRNCSVILEPGARIVSLKTYAKAGFNSQVTALLLEQSSGVFADPQDNLTDGCSVSIDNQNQTAGYDPARTSYSSPCSMRVKDEKAYVLTLYMQKGPGDDAAANVLQSVQIQYSLPRAGVTIPTRVNGTN